MNSLSRKGVQGAAGSNPAVPITLSAVRTSISHQEAALDRAAFLVDVCRLCARTLIEAGNAEPPGRFRPILVTPPGIAWVLEDPEPVRHRSFVVGRFSSASYFVVRFNGYSNCPTCCNNFKRR